MKNIVGTARTVVLVLMLLTVAGVASANESKASHHVLTWSSVHADSDVNLSWQRALVYYKDNFFPRSPSTAKIDNKLPVVVYMHGCTGITDHDIQWARFLAKNGYAVIMPDSFKRKGRVSVCDPRNTNWNISVFPQVDVYRLEEIYFALENAQFLEWADKDRLYLMGHSEGGYAATRFAGSGFKGIIISGRQCGRNNRKRLFVMDTIPVLNLLFTKDPWYLNTWWEGSCRLHRNDVEEVVIDGVGHDTYYIEAMRDKVLEFLDKHR